MSNHPRILVTGASGQLGRRVVELLLDAGATVVAGTRDVSKLADLKSRGNEVRRVDFDDVPSLPEAFAGVDRVLLVSTDALMIEGQRERQQVAAAKAAAAAGVKHIVYTSMIDPAHNLYIPIAPSHAATEKALAESGIPHTILRNSWYLDQLVDTLKGALATGQWVTSGGDGKVGYVTREDCAKVAAAALLKGGPTGTFDVTGSEAVSPAEIAALASTATGKPLTVVQISEETQAEGMRAAHVPEMIVALATGIERLNREGGMSKISNTVERFTGQKPERLADYLAASKTALVA